MNENTATVCIMALLVSLFVVPLSIMAYQEGKTKQVAMEHGYVQVEGKWIKIGLGEMKEEKK